MDEDEELEEEEDLEEAELVAEPLVEDDDEFELGFEDDDRIAEISARIASRIDDVARLSVPLLFAPKGSII